MPGVTNRDLAFDVAKIFTALHLEVPLVGEGGSPRVSKKPIVDVTRDTPTKHLDAMTTDLVARGLSVDTGGVVLKEGAEVGVDVEASFDGSVLVDFVLVGGNLFLGKTLERTSLEGLRIVGTVITLSLMALVDLTVAGVIRGTPRGTPVSTSSSALVDQVVPSGARDSGVAALSRAINDRLRGEDGSRLGFATNTGTVSEGLHRAEGPATVARTLSQDVFFAVPVATRIEVGGHRSNGAQEQHGDEGEAFQHGVMQTKFTNREIQKRMTQGGRSRRSDVSRVFHRNGNRTSS